MLIIENESNHLKFYLPIKSILGIRQTSISNSRITLPRLSIVLQRSEKLKPIKKFIFKDFVISNDFNFILAFQIQSIE